jgi:hypothetical protein
MSTRVAIHIDGEDRAREGELVDCYGKDLLDEMLNKDRDSFVKFRSFGGKPLWVNKRFIKSVLPLESPPDATDE